ncbi:hypothetical protein QQS21_009756 [Conoideocrella luteorostrata]|uniref:Zn(2)-C6 fungal-type domain-containing protein n=1 Tax=Conoideocrella luteorostrata TaxID=1105319 RepID=A0AAJ0FQ14_9HYPO|nr:hypothetical protein QQS21_009756 [Conoideocrella luteorostrata]
MPTRPKASESAQPGPPVRQRKAHRKSRLGCSNCKLRSVKCDEAKPSCQRCLCSGFTCTYSPRSVTDLQFSQAGVFKVDLGGAPLQKLWNPGLHRSIPLVLPAGGKLGSYELRGSDLSCLDHFLNSTSRTLGGGQKMYNTWYTKGALGLSNSYPFLLHIFLVLSQLHDMHEKSTTTTHIPPRRSLAFHWYHGTALFHQMLSKASAAPALSSSERDALWIAAAMLGTAAFAYLGSLDPHRAWPLKDHSPDDLDWLKMGSGKKAVWELTDPTRSDSMFSRMSAQQTRDPPPDGHTPVRPHTLPALFYSVFELGHQSTAENNPYHVAASLISQLLPSEPTPLTVHRFLSFLSQIDPRYQALLGQKDPRAMVLLLYWLAKMVAYPAWWTKRRALYEGLAICIYIERHYAKDAELMQLVAYPAAVLSAVYAEIGMGIREEDVVVNFQPLTVQQEQCQSTL